MIEGDIDAAMVFRQCEVALDGWGLDAAERRDVLIWGIGSDESGAPVALETRARHIVDVDRSVACLIGRHRSSLSGSGCRRIASTGSPRSR